jgi:hypothetical protein
VAGSGNEIDRIAHGSPKSWKAAEPLGHMNEITGDKMVPAGRTTSTDSAKAA